MLAARLMGTTTALLLIGVFSYLLPMGALRASIVLLLTVSFLAFQQGAVSPVTWLLLAEIFPLKLRGFGLGIAVLALWLTNFLVGLTLPILVAAITISNTFFSSSPCSGCSRSCSSSGSPRRLAVVRSRSWRKSST